MTYYGSPSPSWYEQPDIPMFNVTCSNPMCGESITWEDASKDTFGNWVCGTCQDTGYKSPEAIIFDCELDDDELLERTILVAPFNYYHDHAFECPVCKNGTEYTMIWNRSTVSSVYDLPHHECTCAQCKEMFTVYIDRD